jgi:hypothetical protein
VSLVPGFRQTVHFAQSTFTNVLEWLSGRLDEGTPKATLRLYFELLDAVMSAAVADSVIADNPCAEIKLNQVFRGLTRAPKWVPSEQEVSALLEVVPQRYRAATWLGAGQMCRLGEVLRYGGRHAVCRPGLCPMTLAQTKRLVRQACGGAEGT